MTILRKGLLLIAVPLVFQLLFVAMLMRVLAEGDEAENWALHTKEVIRRTEKAYGQLTLVQAASRGFVISASRPFADDEQVAAAAARAEFDEIHQLVGDNPAQQARLQTARDAAEKMIRWNVEQAHWAGAGRKDEAVDRIASLEGRQKLAAARTTLDAFLRGEEQLDRDRTRMLAETRSAERWSIGLGTFGMTGVTIIAAYYFSRSISMRITVVTRNAELLASNSPLGDLVRGKDEITRLDAVMHDASQRLIEADAAETRYKAELEERAGELARTNESLRQQTQDNEMFVYSVSHDLRSPLVNLQGFSKELEHGVKELTRLLEDARVPAEMRQQIHNLMEHDVAASLKFIRTAVSRSSGIIDALLRLSRAGRVEYRWQEVDIRDVVQRVVDAMRGTIRERRAEIVIGELQPAWGDATAVEQILGNLIGNAVNYLDPERAGCVEIGMLDSGDPDDKGLRTYYVKDTGLGIPAAYLSKVFVAFQRLHGNVAHGEGIGLALVRRMVERHGGRVWVESTEGVGTSFFVALPIQPAQQDEAAVVATES